VREVTAGSPEGVLVFSAYSEQDGSMRIDLSSLERGVHTYKIVYIVWDISSAPVHCALTVTAVESKNITKKISSYSLTKTWILVVPRSSVSTVKMAE
jgi:hypothetical protein